MATHFASHVTYQFLFLLFTLLPTIFAVSPVSYAPVGRWGQSASLLSTTLIIYGGRVSVPGQTYDSSPNTNDLLALDLSQSISNLSSPGWVYLAGSSLSGSPQGPTTAFSTLSPVADGMSMLFGGDDQTGTPTRNDSVWFLEYDNLKSMPTWKDMSSSWASEPERRIRQSVVSASNSEVLKMWVFGGLLDDGSGIGFSDVWEFDAPANNGNSGIMGSTALWTLMQVEGDVPLGMYDQTSTMITSSSGSSISIYVLGGALLSDPSASPTTPPSLFSFSQILVFTPSLTSSTPSGTWSLVNTTGSIPTSRRGHVAVDIGNGKIWIQGGANEDGSVVYQDAAVLDTTLETPTWTTADGSGAGERWGHSAVMVGGAVVVCFGYGTNGAADPGLAIYDPATNSWQTGYNPVFTSSTTTPGISNSAPAATGTGGTINPSGGSGTSPGSTGTGVGIPVGTGTPGSTPTGDPNVSGSPNTGSGTGTGVIPGSDPSASISSSPSTSTIPPWAAPGQSSSTSTEGASSSKTPLILGVVLGTFAALALVGAVAYYAIYRKKSGRGYSQFDDDDNEKGGGGGGAMKEARQEASGDSSVHGPRLMAVRNVGGGVGEGGGVRRALTGFWGAGGMLSGGGGEERRFDMLDDESEMLDAYDRPNTSSPNLASSSSVQIPSPASQTPSSKPRNSQGSMSDKEDIMWGPRMGSSSGYSEVKGGRAGMGVWDGLYGSALGSSKSFLGGALAGWAAGSRNRRKSNKGILGVDDDDDPFASDEEDWAALDVNPDDSVTTPPLVVSKKGKRKDVSYEEVDRDDDIEESVASHFTQTSNSHHYASSSASGLLSSHSGPSIPSSGAGSGSIRTQELYGSSMFAPVEVDDGRMHDRSKGGLKRNGSWWDKLVGSGKIGNRGEHKRQNNLTLEPIRDPAPPPNLDPIEEDPFIDRSSGAMGFEVKRKKSLGSDEMGRSEDHSSGTSKVDNTRRSKLFANRSTDSKKSAQTARSSLLEGISDMVVVQRERTGTSTPGEDDELYHDDTSSDFERERMRASTAPAFSQSNSNSTLATMSTPAMDRSNTTMTSSDLTSLSSMAPIDRVITSSPNRLDSTLPDRPPTSPKGPRPAPPKNAAVDFGPALSKQEDSQPSTPSKSHNKNRGSVKDLISAYEKKNTISDSGAGTYTTPPRARKGSKIDVGLAKKPTLFVANPDFEEQNA